MNIKDILSMGINERRNKFQAKGIEKVVIDNNEFTDYKAFSFLWELSYITPPERSSDGTIENLNSYSTFITPHLKIDFSMLSIDSYRKIMKMLYEKREFIVKCYDIVYDTITENKMYFTTEEMPKLWAIARALNGEQWVELLGVQDYTVEMVGTNASLETVNILYYDNDKENGVLIADASQVENKNTEVIIGYDFTPPSPYKFTGVWLDKDGKKYKNGDVITVISELKLYAELVNENEYTLSFNYGNGISPIQSNNAQPLINIPIKENESISTAISKANIQTTDGIFVFPANGTGLSEITYKWGDNEHKINGERAYSFLGWYWTSEANEKSKVTGESLFDYNVNRTIFQIYEPVKYNLVYHTNTNEISLDTQQIPYKQSVTTPRLALKNYSFVGWFLESDFKTQISQTFSMPPQNVHLYAKWEEIK